MTGPLPGPPPGPDRFNADGLVAEVDALLSSDVEGAEEAELLERAHRLIADALDGHRDTARDAQKDAQGDGHRKYTERH